MRGEEEGCNERNQGQSRCNRVQYENDMQGNLDCVHDTVRQANERPDVFWNSTSQVRIKAETIIVQRCGVVEVTEANL